MSYKVTIPKYGTERIRPLYPAPPPCDRDKRFRNHPFAYCRKKDPPIRDIPKPVGPQLLGAKARCRPAHGPDWNYPLSLRPPSPRMAAIRASQPPQSSPQRATGRFNIRSFRNLQNKNKKTVPGFQKTPGRLPSLHPAFSMGIYIPLYTTCLSARSTPDGRQPVRRRIAIGSLGAVIPGRAERISDA